MSEPKGRTHRRLVSLLEELGFSHVDISPQVGHWRSSPYADVVRWEGWAVDQEGLQRSVYS